MKKTSFTYEGKHALQVAMPVGGIGAGNVSLAGNGALEDFSIRHVPQKSAVPDGWQPAASAFGLVHIRGQQPVTRLLEGPLPVEKIYNFGLNGQGLRRAGYEGMPRFAKSKFEGEFPFGHVHLSDPKLPLAVTLTAFNPYIPLDAKNSGIPCVILEYTFTNRSRRPVEFDFVYNMSSLTTGKTNGWKGEKSQAVPGRGVLFTNDEAANSETFGSSGVWSLGAAPVIKAAWLRGGWFDAMSALWREVDEGRFAANKATVDGQDGRVGGSLLFKGQLKPGASATFPLVFTWYLPNVCWRRGDGNLFDPQDATPYWQPYYAGQWTDAADVAKYVRANYATLRARTLAFKDALFGSTLPREVIDAVSANLGILKSPTALRQKNGNFWGWEGCGVGWGSCDGTCTHVWNYAQVMPHLFPDLERTVREQELLRSMDEHGHVNFRAAIPDGPKRHHYHAAADGQLGGIMKVWREWQISGDNEWLGKMWPAARLSLEFCIGKWDPDRQGALVEPHHNTYDIEFWGPDGMCNTIYLGALSAAALMADATGADADAAEYRRLAAACAKFLDAELFNGEYYYQQVQYKNLRDKSFVEKINTTANDEVTRLLKKEGPKYQYGTGCLSDGVIGAWMALLYGIETPVNRANVRKTLSAIYKHNFRRDLSGHANLQRPGYAIGHEAGLLLCSWPRGGKPTLPFVYSDEVWTGIEYQVAVHLILEGKVREGLELVKTVRGRYDGTARNPYDEYECGSYYARAMASYALLPALSGYRYSAVSKTLWFGPQLPTRPFKVFFSAASGYGTIALTKTTLTVTVLEGALPVNELQLTVGGKTKTLAVNGSAKVGRPLVVKV
ncbi:MAG: hypothetical protein LBK71_05965 [Verrucomicrobiales bacterium]|nr:hypothetical protein [Verrucomicrobiales bacterium]